MCINTYIYIYIYTYTCIIQREREREIEACAPASAPCCGHPAPPAHDLILISKLAIPHRVKLIKKCTLDSLNEQLTTYTTLISFAEQSQPYSQVA